MYTTLDIEYGRQVATISLAHPESRNALDATMIAEIIDALESLAVNEEVRAVMIAGQGSAFCAGTDMAGMDIDTPSLREGKQLARLLETLYTFPRPTIARIQGACFGAGMGLAAACDIAIASRDALFGLPETRLGIIPTAVSPYVLKALGARAASRWFLTGETFGAVEALRTGFIHDLCEIDELEARASALLGSFMMAAPEVLSESKRLIRETSGSLPGGRGSSGQKIGPGPQPALPPTDAATPIAVRPKSGQNAGLLAAQAIRGYLESRMSRLIRAY